MKKESLYLDTSVPSAYFDERTKERQGATIKFWEEVLPHYMVYVSETTVKELDATKDEALRKKLRNLIKEFNILKSNKKIRDLAKIYIERGVFPKRYADDALHDPRHAHEVFPRPVPQADPGVVGRGQAGRHLGGGRRGRRSAQGGRDLPEGRHRGQGSHLPIRGKS